MKLRCRLGWHNWQKWTMVATAPQNGADNGWAAAQIRQCADCWRVETDKWPGGYVINTRPLRQVVVAHVLDLRHCVKAIKESECAAQLERTSQEMSKAADELSVALDKDIGRPLVSP